MHIKMHSTKWSKTWSYPHSTSLGHDGSMNMSLWNMNTNSGLKRIFHTDDMTPFKIIPPNVGPFA